MTSEDTPEPDGGADESSTAETTASLPESEGEAEDATEESDESDADDDAEADAADTGVERRPSRLGRGWLAGIAAALVLAAGAIGAGG
jgi:hypothetical protein